MAENPPEEAADNSFFASIRDWGVTRGPNGWLGGVVEGAGARVGMAAAPARLLAVLALFILGGLFMVAYAAAWLLLPDDRGRIIVQDFGRGTPNVGALVGAALIFLIGVGNLDSALPWFLRGDGDAASFVLTTLFIGIGVLVVWIVARGRRNNAGLGDTPAAMPAAGAAATPPKSASAARAATPPAAERTTAQSTATPAPPAPARPPVPYTPGPGRELYLGTFGVLILAAAGVGLAEYLNRLAVAPFAAWAAVALLVIGAAIALAGALGRRVGFLGFLATIFVIGWMVAIFAAPRVESWAEENVRVSIDGVEYELHELEDEVPWDEFDDEDRMPSIDIRLGED